MADQDKEIRDEEKRDAQKMASLLKAAHSPSEFRKYLGVAISSYMNGVIDTCKSFDAAKPAV